MSLTNNDYQIELVQDYTDESQHRLILDVGNLNFSECLFNFLDLLDSANKLELERHWKSKYNDYIEYDYEPFCTEGFCIHWFIFSKDLNLLKYVAYELESFLDKLVNLEKDFEAKNYIDKNHIGVTEND